MTLFLSVRAANVGGPVVDGFLVEADGNATTIAYRPLGSSLFQQLCKNKHVLFATHGFNVSRTDGVRSLGRLETALNPTAAELFVGVLWPGDFWIPVVNYPFEGSTAIKSGERLAAFCNANAANAQSLSFVSHSLGARVILQAAAGLSRKPRLVCVMAGAVNDDCLSRQYSIVAAKSDAIATLSSKGDHVLRLAYPLGDIIADLLHQDHAFGEQALGRDGPRPPLAANIAPSEIADNPRYDHGDYLPPAGMPPTAAGKWTAVAGYVARDFRGQPPLWP